VSKATACDLKELLKIFLKLEKVHNKYTEHMEMIEKHRIKYSDIISWQEHLILYSLLMKGPKVDENKKPIEEHWKEIGKESIDLYAKSQDIWVNYLDLSNFAWD